MALIDIYRGVWTSLWGPRSISTTAPENPLVINDDGSINVIAAITIPGDPASDGSGTITLGGTAQTLFGAVVPTNGFGVYNPDPAEDLWISLFSTAAIGASGSVRLAANGGWYETPPNMKPSNTVSIIAATTGHKFTADKW
jgi:hypothetical protein